MPQSLQVVAADRGQVHWWIPCRLPVLRPEVIWTTYICRAKLVVSVCGFFLDACRVAMMRWLECGSSKSNWEGYFSVLSHMTRARAVVESPLDKLWLGSLLILEASSISLSPFNFTEQHVPYNGGTDGSGIRVFVHRACCTHVWRSAEHKHGSQSGIELNKHWGWKDHWFLSKHWWSWLVRRVSSSDTVTNGSLWMKNNRIDVSEM